MDQTLDQGYILGGSTNKYDPGGGGDPYIMKLNSCGELEWCKVINTPGVYDYAEKVKQTQEGQYVVLTSYSDPNIYNRIQLFKINSAGDLLWKRNYLPPSGAFDDDGTDLIILNDGYVVTGTCYYPDPGHPGGYERPYIFKTDTAGNLQWQLVYGSISGFHGFIGDINPTIHSSTGNLYNDCIHSNSCDKLALIKCLGTGNESYYQDLYPQTCPGGGGPINFLNDSTFVAYVGGTINNIEYGKWINTDTLGQERFCKPFNDIWISKTECSIITFDDKIVSLSHSGTYMYLYKLNQNFDYDSVYTRSYVYDSACPHPVVSDTISLDCGLIVNVNEPFVHPEKTRLTVFPNPATNSLYINFPQFLNLSSGLNNNSQTIYNPWESTVLEAYSINGNIVFSQEIPINQDHLELNVTSWPRGIYLFRLVYSTQTVSSEKVILN